MTILGIIGIAAVVILVLICSVGKSGEQPISFDRFIDDVGETADNFMISEAKKTGLRFVGGKCEISFDGSAKDVIAAKVDIYALDENKKWKMSTMTTKRNVSKFTDDPETKKKIQGLHDEPLKFDVKVPEKGEKD